MIDGCPVNTQLLKNKKKDSSEQKNKWKRILIPLNINFKIYRPWTWLQKRKSI